jgi:Asp-tRNA(Asn)/Glu-tRNA(Gln) amidotransferase A subunit family amidase
MGEIADQMWDNAFMADLEGHGEEEDMPNVLQSAIAYLESRGHKVVRLDFPPEPLPGLYDVDRLGYDLTERQVIHVADQLP